ncbi:MAG: NADH-quinone oxidoreductase subunit K [Acidimicrobiales bacterium 20-64-4]|nr:NADH-quinone oxidoreductase subunit NuoK [Acidobacteriota bacterium]OYV24019.1 MAG: NADH-quinone oxidoreductase subunit K [Acidimicrobiales bacterium 20-64-4]
MSVPASWYLVLSAVLFGIGVYGFLTKRSVLIMLMCVELMLNAVNLTFVTFARTLSDIAGQTVVFFVMVVAAAEVTVGLGITVAVFRRRRTTSVDELTEMQG